jgi:hypothetical protein
MPPPIRLMTEPSPFLLKYKKAKKRRSLYVWTPLRLEIQLRISFDIPKDRELIISLKIKGAEEVQNASLQQAVEAARQCQNPIAASGANDNAWEQYLEVGKEDAGKVDLRFQIDVSSRAALFLPGEHLASC